MASRLAALNAVDETPTVDSSSMIDMVFQLLLFFMVSSRLLLNTIDPDVTIPNASNAKPTDNAAGRIIVHVFKDGSFAGMTRKDEPLADSSAVMAYIDQKRQVIEAGVTPKILLRGDKESIVKYSKEVVQAAGRAGVNTIIFSAYPVSATK